MECNKYKKRCPGNLSTIHSRYQPYGRPYNSQVIHSPLEDVSPYAVFSPTFTNLHLPLTSPLTPSCAYYKTSTPRFTYPEDLLPPTSIFTASLARGLMEEEYCDEYSEDGSSLDPIHHFPSIDMSSILSLPLNGKETESYDIFNSISTDFPDVQHVDCVSTTVTDDFHQVQQVRPVAPTLTDDKALLKALYNHQTDVKVKAKNHITKDTAKKHVANEKHKTSRRIEHIDEPSKKFQCEYCLKTFRSKDSREIHMRIHTGEKPYKCDICQRRFTDNSTYIKHLRIHTNEKPYVCDVCNKSFSQSGNLKRHKRKLHKLC